MAQFIVLNFLLVIGVMLSLLAWFFYSKAQNFVRNSKSITGKVIDLQSKNGTSITALENTNQFVCAPIIEYTTHGETSTFKSNFYTNNPKHKIGDNINLLFDPNTNKIKENSTLSLYTLPIILGVNAIVLIIVGLIVFNLLPLDTRPF